MVKKCAVPWSRTPVGEVVDLTRVQQVLKLPEHSVDNTENTTHTNQHIQRERVWAGPYSCWQNCKTSYFLCNWGKHLKVYIFFQKYCTYCKKLNDDVLLIICRHHSHHDLKHIFKAAYRSPCFPPLFGFTNTSRGWVSGIGTIWRKR